MSATAEIARIANDWVMTESVDKTKGMAVGRNVADEDETPLDLQNSSVEIVDTFQYLGSCIDAGGVMNNEVVLKSIRLFEESHINLSISTKYIVQSSAQSCQFCSTGLKPGRKRLNRPGD